jgi:hypothetical protein
MPDRTWQWVRKLGKKFDKGQGENYAYYHQETYVRKFIPVRGTFMGKYLKRKGAS